VVTGWALEHALPFAEYRRELPVHPHRILLVTVLPELSRFPTVISLRINYVKDSVTQYGRLLLQTRYASSRYCGEFRLARVYQRTAVNNSVHEFQLNQLTAFAEPHLSFLNCIFLELEMPGLIGFGLNTVDRSESGTLLNSCISNTVVNAGAAFLFCVCLKGSLLQV